MGQVKVIEDHGGDAQMTQPDASVKELARRELVCFHSLALACRFPQALRQQPMFMDKHWCLVLGLRCGS